MTSESEPPAKRQRHSQPDHGDSLDSGIGSSQSQHPQPWEATESRTIQREERMPYPVCWCNDRAKNYETKKEGENQGRWFWRCSLPMGHSDRCQFFRWDDQLSHSDYTCHVQKTITAEEVTAIQKEMYTQKVQQVIEEETVDVARLQMAVVGSFGAGKTCFCDTFFNHPFSKETDSTEGITWTHTCAFLREGKVKTKNRPLLEKAAKNELLFRAAASAINIEEISEEVEKESDEVLQKVPVCDGAVQSHSSEDSTSSEVLESVVNAVSSKKTAAGTTFVDVLDCGGQLSFSVLQSICFTAAGSLFVLAINGTWPLDRVIKPVFRRKGHPDIQLLMSQRLKHKSYILLWLSTLADLQIKEGHTTSGHETPHVVGTASSSDKDQAIKPRVVIVITHCAKLTKRDRFSMRRDIATLVKESCARQSVNLTDIFCVDSETKDGIPEVHRHLSEQINEIAQRNKTHLLDLTIEHAIRQRQPFQHSRKPLPPILSIDQFRDYCTAHRQSKPRHHISLADSHISAESTPDSLVEYLHCNGTIRCFAKKPYNSDDFVFPNLQWLITQIARILSCAMKGYDLFWFDISEDIELLKERGILTKKLLRIYLWKDVEEDVQDHLLQVMKQFGLQCPVKKPRESLEHHGPMYYVPMCICRADSPSFHLPGGYEALPPVMFASITEFLPVAFYSRLVVWLLQQYQLEDSELQLDLLHMRFSLDGPCFADVAYESRGLAATVHVCTDAMNSRGPTWISEVAHRLLTNIETQLRKLQQQDCPALNWKLMFPCRPQQQRSVSGKVQVQQVIEEQEEDNVFPWLNCHWVDPALLPRRTAAVGHQKIQEKMLICKTCGDLVPLPPNWRCWLDPSYQCQIKKTDMLESSETAPCRANADKATDQGVLLKPGMKLLRRISRKITDMADVEDIAIDLLEHVEPYDGKAFVRGKKDHGGTLDPSRTAHDVLYHWCCHSSVNNPAWGQRLYEVLEEVVPRVAEEFKSELLSDK